MKFTRFFLSIMLSGLITGLIPVGVARANPSMVKATYIVNKTADTNDGACSLVDCSLREAVIAAQAVPGSLIYLPAFTFSLTLSGADENNSASGDLDIWVDTQIVGVAGALVDGVSADRVFHLRSGTLRLEQVGVSGGHGLTGAALRVEPGATLILDKVTLQANSAVNYGGGIYVGTGASVTLRNSSLHGNTAGQDGGAIYNLGGTVYLVNSTISNNHANRHGGGVYHYGPGKILGLYSVTLAQNTADADSSGDGQGGGVYQDQITSQVNFTNSLIAGNYDLSGGAPDCLGMVNSLDYNLVQNTSGCVIQGTTTHNFTGVNPWLESLANNGGSTLTHRIGINSPALDAGNPSACQDQVGVAMEVDQRGEARSQDGNGDGTPRCDIGAYERETMPQAVVTQISHTLSGSSQAHTAGAQLTIGELVTLHALLTFPPGQAQNATLTVTLDPGLAWVGCDDLTAPGLDTSLAGGLSTACASPSISAYPAGSLDAAEQGRQAVLNLGNLANRSAGNLSLGLTYTAAVLNVPSNTEGVQLDSLLTWSADGQSLDSTSQVLSVVEPGYSLDMRVMPPYGNAEQQLLVTLEAVSVGIVGYEVVLTAPIIPEIHYYGNTLALESGLAPDLLQGGYSPLGAYWSSLSGASRLVYRAKISQDVPNGNSFILFANLTWSSLPGTVNVSLSPYNSLAVERSYIPDDVLNDYFVEASSHIGAPDRLPATGFAPWGQGRQSSRLVTNKVVGEESGLSLEIPRLNASMPIWSVPFGAQGWDLTWLGSAVGHLEGTAFPTWAGNSVLTGHAYLANGLPGPFAFLPSLQWGDQLIVHAFGQDYIFAVRQVTQVEPDDLSPLRHEELPWLTLISCRGYDPETDTYRWRTVVRAVLIEVR